MLLKQSGINSARAGTRPAPTYLKHSVAISYYRTNKKNQRFFFNLFSPDLSFRLKGENLKGLAIVAFYIIGKYHFPII